MEGTAEGTQQPVLAVSAAYRQALQQQVLLKVCGLSDRMLRACGTLLGGHTTCHEDLMFGHPYARSYRVMKTMDKQGRLPAALGP